MVNKDARNCKQFGTKRKQIVTNPKTDAQFLLFVQIAIDVIRSVDCVVMPRPRKIATVNKL